MVSFKRNDYEFILDFGQLKDKLISFHKRTWKNALILDWIPSERPKHYRFLSSTLSQSGKRSGKLYRITKSS